jgi:hypothetical protein
LEKGANGVYKALSPAEQKTAKRIFIELTQLGEGTPDTRRQLSQQDLVTSLPFESALINQVIQKLVAANLVVTDKPKEEQVAIVNIAHEALTQHWGQLRGWLDDNRDAIKKQRDIEADAHKWQDSKQSKNALLQGLDLNIAKDYAKTHTEKVALSELAQDFVQRSVERQRHYWQGVIGSIVGVMLVLAGIAFYANEQRIVAEEQRIEADEQRKRAEKKAHEILVKDATSLGNRGAWKDAFDNYTKAIKDNYPDRIQLEVGRLRAFFPLGNRSALKQELDKFQTRNDLGNYEATVLLLHGDFIMSESGKGEEGLALVRKALETGNLSKLNPADTPYAEGLLAKSFKAAIIKFREALNIDPFHHRANTALLTMLLFSGEFDEARQRAEFMRVVFPHDSLSVFAEAWIELLEGNRTTALKKLEELRQSNLSEAEIGILQAYLRLMGDILDIVKRMDAFGEGLSFIDTLSLLAKVWQWVIMSQEAVLGQFGLNLPTVRLLFDSVGEVLKAYQEDIFFGNTESAVRRLTHLNEVHPDAIFLHLRAVFQIKLAVRKYFKNKKDNAWLDDWKITNQLLRKASQAPSILPLFFKRDSRIFAMWTDAILLEAQKMPRDLKRMAQLRKDIHWLLDKGQLRPSERNKLIPEIVNLVASNLGRSLLIDWQEKEPKNFTPIKLLAKLEWRASNYVAALESANRVLTHKPDEQDMLKVKKVSIEGLKKTLEAVYPEQ